jgi:hypothetical protein
VANELTLNASISYEDSEDTTVSPPAIADLLASVATKKWIGAKQNIGTSEEAVTLGEVTAPGWALFINRDETNFINLKVATGGSIFAKLKPGEFALLRLGSGAQAPFAISDTAACQMEYWLFYT